jgi:hypothetical protein
LQKGEFIDLQLQVGGESDFGHETRRIGMHRIVAALISEKLRSMISHEGHSDGSASGVPHSLFLPFFCQTRRCWQLELAAAAFITRQHNTSYTSVHTKAS